MIWGNGFRDLGPSNGELTPPRTACSRAGARCGRGSPPPAEGVRRCHPRNFFFEIFDAKSHVWGQFGPENKLIEGQPNEYDHGAKRRFYTVVRRDLPERVSVSVPPVANDSCRSAVPAPKYLPERRSIAFPHYYTPVHDVSRMSHISL